MLPKKHRVRKIGPKSEHLSSGWAEFLLSPLPLGEARRSLDNIQQEGNRQLRYVLELAARTGVLPQTVGLAQFLHIRPETKTVDLEVPTLVRSDMASALLFASAIQGASVKGTKVSFFQRAVPRYMYGRRGLLCTVSQASSYRPRLSHTDTSSVHLHSIWAPVPGENIAAAISALRRDKVGGTKWDYVRGNDVAQLFSENLLMQNCRDDRSDEVDTLFRDLMKQGEKNDLDLYLTHISPATSLGSVVLCVPNMFMSADGSHPSHRPMEKAAGGGGMMFIVEEPLDDDLCQTLYYISHRVCSLATAIWDMVQSAYIRAEELGFQRGEYMISHEVDTPIGILNLERDRLSEEGRMAVDYLELWRRFIKREWSEALPKELDALFSRNNRLMVVGFRFGYARALLRSQVPKHVVKDRLEFWSYADMLLQMPRWLDYSIDLPEDLLTGNAGWVFQVKTWTLFFVIASCQHTIKYAFNGAGCLDDWDDNGNIRRAWLNVRWKRVNQHTGVIEIINSGDDRPPEYPCHTDVIQPIGSVDFGKIDLPVPRADVENNTAKGVKIFPSRKVTNTETGQINWIAEIIITDIRSDHG